MTNIEAFIRDQFPFAQWPVIPTILRTAYAAADDLCNEAPFLQVTSARENKGRLVSWAVDFGIERAINSGSLTCEYAWREFARPTGRFLQLQFSHSTASISQVSQPNQQPRNVCFRANLRLRNQALLPFKEFEKDNEINGKPHFLIIHGHRSLDFAHLAVPSATSDTKYSWKSRNLMQLPHVVATPYDYPPEDTDFDFDELELLKDDIRRWMVDNNE